MRVRLRYLGVEDVAKVAPGARPLGGDAVDVDPQHVAAVLEAEHAARAAAEAAAPPGAGVVVQGLIRHLGVADLLDGRLTLAAVEGGILVRGPQGVVQAALDADAAHVEAICAARARRGKRRHAEACDCGGKVETKGSDGDGRCSACGAWL